MRQCSEPDTLREQVLPPQGPAQRDLCSKYAPYQDTLTCLSRSEGERIWATSLLCKGTGVSWECASPKLNKTNWTPDSKYRKAADKTGGTSPKTLPQQLN